MWRLTVGHSSAKERRFLRVEARCLISCRVLLIISLTLSALKSLYKSTQSSVSAGMLLAFYLKVEKETVNSGVSNKWAGLPILLLILSSPVVWME